MGFEGYLKSRVNQKIIRFFLENPSSIDTSRGIATWINEDIGKTKKALKELLEAKLLVLHGDGATYAYSSTPDARIIARIKTYLKKRKTKSIIKHRTSL